MIKFTIFLLILTANVIAIESIPPLPLIPDYERAKALLGKKLFSDPILSADGTVACVSCHNFEYGGADPRRFSVGISNQSGNIHSPTVFNARYNFKQFWNGRAEDLNEQARGPILNPAEMGSDAKGITARLNADANYRQAFQAVFKTDEISFEQVIDAITEFEKALVTPNSKFDRYLRKETVLTPLEEKGYQHFKNIGCITCHNGINIGGNTFQKMGLINEYRNTSTYPDRHALTRKTYHHNVFKVPTLRNIALTAPYFHDGSAATLREAIDTMSYHNLGIKPDIEEVDALIAFLETLTGIRPAILDIP